MLTIIKPRGDIKSNWESTNPTLRMREWGIEWETTVGVGEVKIKIGDGVTPWLTLDYVLVNDVTKKIVKTFAEVTVENPELAAGSSMDMLWAVAKKKFDFLNTAVVKINGDIDGLNTSLTNVKENGDIDLTEVDVPSFTDYATDDTTIPDARTAISNITSSIKVPAFISNAKAALRGLVTLGEMRSLLVNSGMTTETGKYFLDAAYGKTLADQISQLNSHNIPKDLHASSLNDIKITGVYYQTSNANAMLERNYPIRQAGMLLVYYCTDDWIYQLYVPYSDTTIFKRVWYILNNGWYPWTEFDGVEIQN
ncbi:MAG: hypothetical protein HFG65_12965 [Hungatella sp.]|nr:hypothetical protein [Hungatella sp.]